MNRALLYLIRRQRVNAARQFVRGLRRPRKLIGLLFWVSVVGLMIWSQIVARRVGATAPEEGATALTALLGFILVASAFGGLMQRGLAFQPADIDFLFPGPFTRRALVLYRLLQLYPMAILSTAFLLVFLGPRMAHAGWGGAGILACQLVALHLQTATAIVAAAVSDRTFGRLRGKIQAVLFVLVGIGMFAGVVVFVDVGDAGSDVRELFRTEAMQKLLYPAAAAARLSTAAGAAARVEPALGLAASVLLTLGLVMALQVNFFEASLETSRRFHKAVSRSRRGMAVVPRKGDKARRIRLPRLPVFRGGGAILWKNLLTAGRSLRIVFFSLMMTAIFASIAIGAMTRIGAGGAPPMGPVLAMGAMLPLMLQQHLAFDFRRDLDSLAELRLLPASPFVVALAEVLVPTALSVAAQWSMIAAASFVIDLPRESIVAVLVGYPVLTLAICTVGNIGFLVYPVRTVTASGRPNTGGATMSALLNMVAVVAAVVPAVAAAFVTWFATESSVAAGAAAVTAQLLVDGALLAILAHLFRTHELTDVG